MYGPEPAAPVLALMPLLSTITPLLVTVVVSLLFAFVAGVKTLVAVTVMPLIWPLVAVGGTTATTMNLNTPPAPSAGEVVIAGPVGWPLPLSAKIWMPVMLNGPLAFTAVRPYVSVPLPVLVRVCG